MAGCGGGERADVSVDGSSTVGPFMQVAASRFVDEHEDTEIDVSSSRSGQGFERFCAGDVDVAKRVAPDRRGRAGPARGQRRRAAFPDVPLKLYGPQPGSGTFRYFTFVVNCERGASRTDAP